MSVRRDGPTPCPDALFELAAPPPDPVVAVQPGGSVVTVGHGRDGLGTATFDRTWRYRFRLSRVWDARRARCCFVLLNPSTADARADDPTLRRCVAFARGWGFGAVEVVNLFALRARDPRELRAAADPVGPGNDVVLSAAARAADLVVAGWGAHGGRASASGHARGEEVRRSLAAAGVALTALRVTRSGHPGHPLYVPASTQPAPWPGSGASGTPDGVRC